MPTDMPTDVPIRCRCGKLRGVARGVSGERGTRLVCCCKDCQSFPHFLGCADEVLDAEGGTDVFQMPPARLELTEGVENLACMRLTDKGLHRWYADCCKTPIGNTTGSPQVPFVGVIRSCMDHAAMPRDEALGPVRATVHGSRKATPPLLLILRFVGMLIASRIRGEHRPSPFFDAVTGKPVVTPKILTTNELAAVEAACDVR